MVVAADNCSSIGEYDHIGHYVQLMEFNMLTLTSVEAQSRLAS